jgi:hypothetical protein
MWNILSGRSAFSKGGVSKVSFSSLKQSGMSVNQWIASAYALAITTISGF